MDIYAEPGTEVVFNHPDAGYLGDKEQATEHLTVGETYTVEFTRVGAWRTDVGLVEVPNVLFNSVFFD